ncbi:hypothetical protein NE237_003039 [Protea cynaroides]|uniref:Uncharacterized protein n=1 Tax=Protea cynaroides TaxID=273540 RepID=A0A9Q0QS26_9MAGN|nr:hypothetical protein NE237_003039 [Protea cynaroides]
MDKTYGKTQQRLLEEEEGMGGQGDKGSSTSAGYSTTDVNDHHGMTIGNFNKRTGASGGGGNGKRLLSGSGGAKAMGAAKLVSATNRSLGWRLYDQAVNIGVGSLTRAHVGDPVIRDGMQHHRTISSPITMAADDHRDLNDEVVGIPPCSASVMHSKELISHAGGEVGSSGSELRGRSGGDRKPWNSQLMVPMLIFLASVSSVVDGGKQVATRGYASRVLVIGLWVVSGVLVAKRTHDETLGQRQLLGKEMKGGDQKMRSFSGFSSTSTVDGAGNHHGMSRYDFNNWNGSSGGDK